MAKKRNVYVTKSGIRVPGVTSITGILEKPALLPWAAKMATEHVAKFWKPGKQYEKETIECVLQDAKVAHRTKKQDAADFGSDVHALVESYIGGQLTPEQVMDEQQRRALENFIKVTEGWKWLGAEIILIHEELLYGGTADGLAVLPNGMTVITDTKTSSGVYPEFDLQVAMYAFATPVNSALHTAWKQIKEARILHFDKERITWEVLERDISSQFPFIPHFRQCYEWKRQFASEWK
jgi:hypothetical protein